MIFENKRGALLAMAASAAFLAVGLRAAERSAAQRALDDFDPKEPVSAGANGIAVTPVQQRLTPAGIQVELPGLRPQVMALSPDRRVLVTSGKTSELIVLNPDTGDILQRVTLPSAAAHEATPEAVTPQILQPDKSGQVSFTGLVFSPDGSRIYMSNVDGDVKVFGVDAARKVAPLYSIPLPKAHAGKRANDIAAGLAISPDGKTLYVCLNLSNRVLEVDLATGSAKRVFEVGVAPYDAALVRNKLFVSNWGGRRPETNSLTGPAGHGTLVRVDPVRHIASEGSVSVIDLSTGKVTAELPAGLHASGLALSPSGNHLVAANANSDTLTVIDTRSDRVVETLPLKWHPNDFFGASPNAAVFDEDGKTLYVCHGTQNAVAVVSFKPGKSKMRGLIPTGWFPGAIAIDSKRKSLFVANVKGIGATKRFKAGEKASYNSHQYFGTVSIIPMPTSKQLHAHTATVWKNYRKEVTEFAKLPPRPNIAPRPVPERAGEPSVFKHVVYVIKENRTYDQVFGDIKEGNGDPSLCVFGEKFTPNQHKMVREFTLLDNTYCSGILSADGHQWADTAFATDYMEKSFAGFPRSYPDGMEDSDVDALAYSPKGFIWDNVLAHGKTFRDYGEFTIEVTGWKDKTRKPAPKFLDFYRDFVNQTGLTQLGSRPAILSVEPHMCKTTVGWSMDVPDVFRAAEFIRELKEFEKKGTWPNFIVICLPNDHTSGTRAHSPTPAAHVADNDLAFGQIVEAISHSSFWKDTCIFGIEDDPQAGWDHVTGYRTTAYVVSPYTKRKTVVSHNYNQTSLIRTMELMLGLPPMNQMDASATPMTECFTDTPDFTPFQSVATNIPLDEMNPEPKAMTDPTLKKHAIASAKLPLDKPDQCPEDLLNRIIWAAQKGPRSPYPAWAVKVVDND